MIKNPAFRGWGGGGMVSAPFWSENGNRPGMVFEETTGVYELIYRFLKIPNEEKCENSK